MTVSQFPSAQWVEFEETRVHPLTVYIEDPSGDLLPIHNVHFQDCIILIPLADPDPTRGHYAIVQGQVEPVTNVGWRAYWNLDTDLYVDADTREKAIQAFREKACTMFSRVHKWPVKGYDDYQDFMFNQ